MTISLFDVQCGFGSASPGQPGVYEVGALLAEMDRLQVERALVRTVPTMMETDIDAANARLYAACAEAPRLTPCPVVLPNSACDGLPDEEAVATLAARGAGAVTVQPRAYYWSLAPWCCDQLFLALQAHRLPVLCLGDEVGLEDVATLAGRYPELPFIIAAANYRQHRVIFPLLAAFPNVYLSLGSNYCVHQGIEQIVGRLGPERLLFGTGYPEMEMPAAIAYLMYAEISDAQKALIGAGNLQRLIEGVQR